MLARRGSEFVQRGGGGLMGVEYGMQPVVIGDDLTVVRLAGLERCADQHVIEAERCRMFKLGRPGPEWSDEGGMKEIAPRRVSVRRFHLSCPVWSCRGVDARTVRSHRSLGFQSRMPRDA